MSLDSDDEQCKRFKQQPKRSPREQSLLQSCFEVPNRRTRSFVGREDIIARIDKAFSPGQGPRIAILHGMGGQGKTQTALEFCHRKRNDPYGVIFWVDATTESIVTQGFEAIYEHIESRTKHLSNSKDKVAFVL